jgi:hypothetical protein
VSPNLPRDDFRAPETGRRLFRPGDRYHVPLSPRHFMGEVEAIEFTTYAALVDRFIDEVHELWRLEDEEK